MKKMFDKIIEKIGKLLYCYYNGVATNQIHLNKLVNSTNKKIKNEKH